MLKWLKTRRFAKAKAPEIYGAVVACARAPGLYSILGVPDTREGRYEMVVLHTFTVLERLREEGPTAAPLARAVAERFVVDMDDSMRQFGVGDLSVPKKVKRAAAGLYDRSMEYRAAMEEGESALAAVLGRHVFDDEHNERARELARYTIRSAHHLNGQSISDIDAGRLSFAAICPSIGE